MSDVIWKPQPRQLEFMRRPEYECLYGGAAGGGKSDALLAEALRQVHLPGYRGLILRKTYPQLTELVDRSRALYSPAFPGAVFNETKHVWVFPSGAKIYFGSMQYTKDRTNYQGRRYDYIAFDELTHFSWDEYSYMFSRNRPGPGHDGVKTRVYMRASANPGGIGHAWVKNRFITAAPPLTPIRETVTVALPGGESREIIRDRVFIPATVFDNARLLEADPNYLGNLALLPEAERRALLYGDWDSFSGQVFSEWRDDPAHYDDGMWTHVINPFIPPKHWRVWRGFDFGFTRPFSVGWFTADEEGRIYHIREMYGCTDAPNTGLKLHPAEIARQIREAEASDPMLKGRDITGVADPAIFEQSHGDSIADLMARHPNYIGWLPGDHSRLAGKMQLHYRLAFDENGDSMFRVFNTCRHFLRTVPALVYDEARPEDVDTAMEDHIYDMTRYVLMESPITPRKSVKPPPILFDPLDQTEPQRYGRIRFG